MDKEEVASISCGRRVVNLELALAFLVAITKDWRRYDWNNPAFFDGRNNFMLGTEFPNE